MCSAMSRRRWSKGTTWSPSFGEYRGGLYARSVMDTGPSPWCWPPKDGGGCDQDGGGCCEYGGATGGCDQVAGGAVGAGAPGGGAVGARCPGKVLEGGCISDCCAAVAPFSM